MNTFKRFDSRFIEGMLTDKRISSELAGRVIGSMRDGNRMSPEEVLSTAKELHGAGLVSSRCPDFITRYPDRVYLDTPKWESLKNEILSLDDVGFLEVGSFLGNEVSYIQNHLAEEQMGFEGYAKGIEINPWHLLVGSLARGDSPDNHEFYIGDACKISEFDSNPQIVYSHGLLHSLNARNSKGKKDTNVHLRNVGNHLKGVHKILDSSGKVVGVAFSSNDYVPENTESGPTPLDRDTLYSEFKDAGFPNRGIYIEEAPLTNPKKGLQYELMFNAKKY